MDPALTSPDLQLEGLKLLSVGKVRQVYEVDDSSLLFVASDRISAYDVIMKNGVPGKGKILTQLSVFWFSLLGDIIPSHFITDDVDKMPPHVRVHKERLQGRSMLVKRLKIIKIEAIVRGYISGSGWKEYQKQGTICSLPLPAGLRESERLPEILFTPSTKADLGEHDENIHPDKAAEIIGKEVYDKVAQASVALYKRASEFALEKGIIIADTKFEFGLDADNNVVLADEVLTPDSSRFWPASSYEVGRSQNSYDKQYLRDYLTSISFDMKEGIVLPSEVVSNTLQKYIEVYKILTGTEPLLSGHSE